MTLYPPLVIEHDRAPRNHGPLAGATHHATLDNPLCGDLVTMHLRIADGRIAAAAFEGNGCALCRAAASLLTERATDLTLDAARDLVLAFERFVHDPSEPRPEERTWLGTLAVFEPLRSLRARRSCATLAFSALVEALPSS